MGESGATIERVYALHRIAADDYLLPSNDGLTIWRIARYTDGPSGGLTDWPRDREVWGLWRWRQPHLVASPSHLANVDDWNEWEFVDGLFDTRAAAIDEALRIGGTA